MRARAVLGQVTWQDSDNELWLLDGGENSTLWRLQPDSWANECNPSALPKWNATLTLAEYPTGEQCSPHSAGQRACTACDF
jgi:hypothetical protein